MHQEHVGQSSGELAWGVRQDINKMLVFHFFVEDIMKIAAHICELGKVPLQETIYSTKESFGLYVVGVPVGLGIICTLKWWVSFSNK